jgi:hypothetical protein
MQRAQDFVSRGASADLEPLLIDCLRDGGAQGLAAVQLIYEDMYDGLTFNYEFKAPAGLCLIHWGQPGLQALVQAALRTPTVKNLAIAMDVLAAVGTDAPVPLIGLHLGLRHPLELVDAAVNAHPDLRSQSRAHLTDLVLSIGDEDTLISAVALSIQHVGFYEPSGAKQVFAALAARWLTVGRRNLNEYAAALTAHAADEPWFQRHFESFPQMLDPMALQLWPQPDFHGFREPDFIIQRTDDSYLVVEIESPSKPLMTAGRQLSAAASHAVSQVLEYRRHLMERVREARLHFPSFSYPDCLVVIGLESSLDDAGKAALVAENQSRNGLRIVGFDWLLTRSQSISNNVIARSVELRRLRYT